MGRKMKRGRQMLVREAKVREMDKVRERDRVRRIGGMYVLGGFAIARTRA
jgi:hypothetical protein